MEVGNGFRGGDAPAGRTGSRSAGGALMARIMPRQGEVPEWPNGADSKSVEGASLPGVRIPPSPPFTVDKTTYNGCTTIHATKPKALALPLSSTPLRPRCARWRCVRACKARALRLISGGSGRALGTSSGVETVADWPTEAGSLRPWRLHVDRRLRSSFVNHMPASGYATSTASHRFGSRTKVWS